MSEVLHPGVFVEEVPFRSKPIEGVNTSTTGFVGPTRFGPLDVQPKIVSSLGDFERTYGDGQQLNFSDAGKMDNYLWHSVRAFFEEGGKRLYISRVFRPRDDDGIATATLPRDGGEQAITVRARYPGEAGNMRVRFDLLETETATVNVTLIPSDPSGSTKTWTAIPADPCQLQERIETQSLPIKLEFCSGVMTAVDVMTSLFGLDPVNLPYRDKPKSVEVTLTGGNDGKRPTASEYEGTEEPKTGIKIFEDFDDISIVAAPGSTFGYDDGYGAEADAIIKLVIGHAERLRNRIAVLDSGNGQSISQVRAMRAKFDSSYAALYYPWIQVLDPISQKEIYLPPSGFVAGIYVRTDMERGVFKAPANEIVNLAIGLEKLLNHDEQQVLNPEGINCIRSFEGRGIRLFGARTISSDPEWKYVNVRRYFAYLEHSIDRGTQWVVFEPNGEQLWANVRRTVEDFLVNEWQMGALMGSKPEEAFFVKCDRSTMTQNDLDNGRLVCLIGVAPVRPAEFVIFRIGQWTADRKP